MGVSVAGQYVYVIMYYVSDHRDIIMVFTTKGEYVTTFIYISFRGMCMVFCMFVGFKYFDIVL